MYYYQSLTEQGRLGAYTESEKVANHQGWLNNAVQESDTETAHDGSLWMKADASKGWTGAPKAPVLSLNEQAMLLSMPKLDFVEMAEALTANMPNPVTWASINEWMQSNPEIQKLFILATEVKRNDPKLDAVTAQFGTEFLPFLDMMFVYKDAIQAEMALAKEQGRPINLDTLMVAGGIPNV